MESRRVMEDDTAVARASVEREFGYAAPAGDIRRAQDRPVLRDDAGAVAVEEGLSDVWSRRDPGPQPARVPGLEAEGALAARERHAAG